MEHIVAALSRLGAARAHISFRVRALQGRRDGGYHSVVAAPNRNQHWVPQFYLRHFAVPETRDSNHPKIWAFPIEEGEEFKPSIRNVAAKRDLYTCCGPEIDEKLTDLESMLSRYWHTFANEHYPIDDGFK